MSTAILNVWVTDPRNRCVIWNDGPDHKPPTITVTYCDGSVVKWSEARYRHHHEDPWVVVPDHVYQSIRTLDGHVEIEIPPGCYVVQAFVGKPPVTEHAMTQAICGAEACVKLYGA